MAGATRTGRLIAASVLGLLPVLFVGLGTVPAGAATATGCSGHATSVNRNGDDIDEASAPGVGGTESNPLKLDAHGSIVYGGSTDEVFRQGTWTVEVHDLPFASDSGTIDNPSGITSMSGTQPLAKYLEHFGVTITGKYYVTVVATAGSFTCTVDAYILITDSPLRTPFFYLSALLILVAFILLVIFGRPEAIIDILAGDYQGATDDVEDAIGV